MINVKRTFIYEVKQMIADGAEEFIECGPGAVLTGLISKIQKRLEA